MIKNIDLHTHSHASDGTLSPAELIRLASEKGLKILSLTDHDTVGGLAEAEEASRKYGIRFIPGLELSIDWPEGDFHLLGYMMDYHNQDLHDTLHSIRENREKRIYLMIEDLKKNGFDLSIEEVTGSSENGSLGKPHIARALIKKGYGENFDDIFKNFMIEGKPGYVPKKKITVEMAFDLLLDAGGFPVLAHPQSLNMDTPKFELMIKDLIDQGLAGIECYSSIHSLEEVLYYKSVAKEYGLTITGGSDFHGDNNAELGFYGPGRAISIEEKDFNTLTGS